MVFRAGEGKISTGHIVLKLNLSSDKESLV